MNVTRVTDGRGSHIEPPFDEAWSNAVKLAWKAAVVAHDTGLRIEVHDGAQLDHNGAPIPGWYSVNVGANSIAALDFRDTWTYLTGVAIGAEQKARHTTA